MTPAPKKTKTPTTEIVREGRYVAEVGVTRARDGVFRLQVGLGDVGAAQGEPAGDQHHRHDGQRPADDLQKRFHASDPVFRPSSLRRAGSCGQAFARA